MSLKNYGNSFVGGRESLDAGKVPVWLEINEKYPAGVSFEVSEDLTAGTVLPIGTPVYVDKLGGTATILDSTSDISTSGDVTGLLLEDVIVGNNGASGDIVTKGQILYSRIGALSASVKAALKNRITFVEE